MSVLAFIDVSWTWVIILLAGGIVLAVAEMLLPSGGILTVAAVAAFVAAVVIAFMVDATGGWLTLLGVVLMTPVLLWVLIKVWPHTPVARIIILKGPLSRGRAGDLSHLEETELEGKVGTAKSLLRPAGKMVLDGRLIDCVTEGQYVRPGRRVRIVDVAGSRVVVRPEPDEEPESA